MAKPGPPSACAGCGNALRRGFLLERQGSRRETTKWVEGEAEPSFWLGLSLVGRRMLPVVAYRCEQCGRVELFAPDAS